MSRDGIESIKGDRFAALVSTCARRIQVTLTGTADLLVSGQLDAFLRQLDGEAQRCPADEVTVDVRALEFMNSSCLKSFVRWICAVQEQTGPGKYRIVFLTSPSVGWQRRSLNALASLADEVVSVQVGA
jgi:hypothetical protein